MCSKSIVESAESACCSCKVCSCAHLTVRVVLCVNPSVVVVTRDTVCHCRSVTEENVLTEVVADDTSVEASECKISVYYCKCTMLDLLEDIVLSVRLMDLHDMSFLVD